MAKYRQFRQEDSAGLDKTSYKITVRQLESMVRLSEALAKLYCEKQVRMKKMIFFVVRTIDFAPPFSFLGRDSPCGGGCHVVENVNCHH